MRQAGRSLPEYRAVRERYTLLEICRRPEVAAEVTLQPVRRLGVDAAIVFSDIVVALVGMGVAVEVQEGAGPVLESPVRTTDDVADLQPFSPDAVDFVPETIRGLVGELEVPLIGFAGAPFTLASYLVEGGSSRDHARVKALMHTDPALFEELMAKLSATTVAYLKLQIEAGAAAVQLFDSWVGTLAPEDFRTHVAPHVTDIFRALEPLDVPRIYFGLSTGELLSDIAACTPDVVGLDWRVPLGEARDRLPGVAAVQGNLDPTVCLAPWPVVREKALDVLQRGRAGAHIFNLGHGVLPGTDPETLARLVDLVHGYDDR